MLWGYWFRVEGLVAISEMLGLRFSTGTASSLSDLPALAARPLEYELRCLQPTTAVLFR